MATCNFDAGSRRPHQPSGRRRGASPIWRGVSRRRHRALVYFVGRPAAMRRGIASAALRVSEGAALGANVAVIMNRSTK
jgi:hypothetical protein